MSDEGWRRFELSAVALTALVFVALPKSPVPLGVFIVAFLVGWPTYGVARDRAEPGLVTRWGLVPSHELRPLLIRLVPLGFGLVGIGVGIAWYRGVELIPPWLWLSLLLYPLYGLVQQWLVQALFVDNVRALANAPLAVLLLLGAVGFGAIHFAHPALVVATGLLGAVYVAWFQRWRNLWPLGIAHGWLGSLFYPWVLDKNPTKELVDAVFAAMGQSE